MKKALFSVLMILVFTLAACVQRPGAIASPTPVTQLLELTQTSVPTPSQEPTWVPLPTIALTPGAAHASLPTFALPNFPTSLTPIPTLDVYTLPTPLPTLGLGTPEPECFVTASKEGIQLELGPFISRYRLLPKMEPGVIYQAIDVHPTFYQLARDGVPVGWVEYITTGLSTEGAGCARLFARSAGTLSQTDFPGLCFFTADRPTQSFQDSALTEPHFIEVSSSGSYPFVVMWKSQKSLFTCLSHAGPCFYVPTDSVSTFGNCTGIPTSATVTTAGWLWSEPDEGQGEKLLRLAAGMNLHIEGNRPPDGSGESAWVQAVFDQENESIAGWIWSGLVSFD